MSSLEERLQLSASDADSLQKDHSKNLTALKQQGEELEKKHRELQDKLTKANERSRKARAELEAEQDVSEKLRKELADVAAQKGTETRKNAVEISRLKVCSSIVVPSVLLYTNHACVKFRVSMSHCMKLAVSYAHVTSYTLVQHVR